MTVLEFDVDNRRHAKAMSHQEKAPRRIRQLNYFS
jgi:hypothetical protein